MWDNEQKLELVRATVVPDEALITASIPVYKRLELAVINLPVAYLLADMGDILYITIHGHLMELMTTNHQT